MMFGRDRKKQTDVRRDPHPETCERCPLRYEAKGCPCWITEKYGFMETNIHTGEERIVTGCFYQVLPKLMMHVVQAANRPAAAFESLRNETAKGLGVIAQVLTENNAAMPVPYKLLESKNAETEQEPGGNQS